MSSSFSISDDDGARARYELDRARSDITRLRLVLWDEYFKAAIIATACSADDVERSAEIADAALAERVKRGGCEGVDWLSRRLGNAELRGRPLNDVLGAFVQPRTLIALTDDQLDKLAPLFLALKSGGAIWGQIFGDGMHVKVISPDDVTKVQHALGRHENSRSASAAESYEAGLQEDANA